MAWTSLCDLSELTEGQGKYVEIDGHRLAVFLYNGQPSVMDDTCPHAGGSMSGGWIDDAACAVCPLHGWGFSLKDGRIKGSGAAMISVYPIRVHNFQGRLLVQAELPTP